MSDSWHIAVDLGASTFKCGLISPEWKVVARQQAPTRPLEGPAQAADRIAEQVRTMQQHLPTGATLNTLGMCAPGPLDHSTGVLIYPPNLTGWRDVPFAEMMRERLGIPVSLEHDAKACALGEFHFGAGRGARSMALIIVGTGIGAAMIVDGKLYRGDRDGAGEVGHITVDLEGPICTCGSTGCVESFAGGPAIVNAYNYATRKGFESGEDVARAARAGDEIAQRTFQRAGRALGAAIATMAMLNDIDTFVLFGSVVNAGDLLLDPAREAVPRYSYPTLAPHTKIRVGELGNDAGILGAAWGATR